MLAVPTLLTVCQVFGLRGGCVTGVIDTRRPGEAGETIRPEQLRLGEEHAIVVGIKAMELLVEART